jgi:hypothetical protein
VHVFCEILRTFGLRNSGRGWRITYYPIADQMPGGPDRRLIFLNPTGPYRQLGLALKSLVQTGRDLEAPFKTVRSRASSKPDWPDYWEPCIHDPGIIPSVVYQLGDRWSAGYSLRDFPDGNAIAT